MSRLFTMFTNTVDPYVDWARVIEAVINKDQLAVKAYIGNYNAVKDEQNNNLLHLATLGEHVEMVRYLLDHLVDKNHINKFGCSPWDYAIRTHNKELIKVYTDKDNSYIDTLTFDNNALRLDNRKLADEKDSYVKEVVILKKNNKRLREENDDLYIRVNALTTDKDKLLAENGALVVANKKLKTSVDSLTQALKK